MNIDVIPFSYVGEFLSYALSITSYEFLSYPICAKVIVCDILSRLFFFFRIEENK